MSDDRELYPLTTPGGQAIPYDVFRPFGFIPVTITDAVSADIAIPTGAELLLVYATIDCVIRFGESNASIPASGTNLADAFFLPALTSFVVDPNAAVELTVIAANASATGKLYISTTKKWKDLQIDTVLNRT